MPHLTNVRNPFFKFHPGSGLAPKLNAFFLHRLCTSLQNLLSNPASNHIKQTDTGEIISYLVDIIKAITRVATRE